MNTTITTSAVDTTRLPAAGAEDTLSTRSDASAWTLFLQGRRGSSFKASKTPRNAKEWSDFAASETVSGTAKKTALDKFTCCDCTIYVHVCTTFANPHSSSTLLYTVASLHWTVHHHFFIMSCNSLHFAVVCNICVNVSSCCFLLINSIVSTLSGYSHSCQVLCVSGIY